MSEKNLSPKERTEREQKIEALRKEHGFTRAHAASIIDAEENRKMPTPEEIAAEAEKFVAEEAKPPKPEPI